MSKFIYIFLLFTVAKLNSQISTNNLINDWTVVNNRMLDGSRNLLFNDSDVTTWKISNNSICEQNYSQIFKQENCYNYKIEKNFLSTSHQSGYEILKLTNDSLVVKQTIIGIDSPDKINKLWLVKTSVLQSNLRKNLNNDSVLIASQKFTPILNKNLLNDILEKFIANNEKSNFHIEGNLLIFPKKNSVKMEIQTEKSDLSKKNNSSIEIVKNQFEKNFLVWDLKNFQSFDKIIIPFVIERRGKVELEGHSTISATFFNDSEKSTSRKPLIKNKMISSENYSKAVEAFNNKKYDKSIEFFQKAYDNDNTNIDPLYNVSSIYLSQNKLKDACSALKILSDWEQTEAIKIFNEKCININ